MKIKICGITSLSDAVAACEHGADALGFVFYKKSPRYILPEQAKQIIEKLPPFVSSVGVFVDEDINTVKSLITDTGLDYVQLHGNEPISTVRMFGNKAIKAFNIKDKDSIEEVNGSGLQYVLLDSHTSLHGGSGKRFDHAFLKNLSIGIKFILSGGITPENVAEIVQTYKPYGIDVSSGVEASPGKKSKEKLTALFINIKKAL
ncbi:MAG: phosphoribosylanthranilate isomerase [Deltaproteobacteria bacterium]|nr:phosphoribosylanthranilate isomerase [Deltaproteobacteria bacterium]MCL5791857.1 phosphoribosylanthranilate isomerase [Deltaproteobacteria bacterium]